MATSLSVGKLIRDLLLQSEEVTDIVTTKKIFPIATDKAVLPYVLYRRAGFEQQNTKAGFRGADTVTMEVVCYAKDYEGSINLAEAVRSALDGQTLEKDGLKLRSCYLSGGDETYEDDAFAQSLLFTIKL